jgi:hypothetical protein
MPRLDIRRTFDDDNFSAKQDIDNILDDMETFLNVTKLDDDNIQDASLTGSTKLTADTISAGKLASSSVTTAKIIDDSVTDDKLASDCAGNGLTQDTNGALAVNVDDSTLEISSDTVQVKDNGVTTAKLGDDQVTNAKFDTGIYFDKITRNLETDLSQSTLAATSVSVTTSGSPVLILAYGAYRSSGVTSAVSLQLKRDSTVLFTYQGADAQLRAWIDNVGAGTYTYTLAKSSGTFTAESDSNLIVMEL